ncbi:hypothetical protein [Pseudoalteromonas byunsanensis]|uniref:Uncharacterized protein n=1 Tax=Pseudoalteromonas byunsanensis TaxID=327939 RepID=A0A1S1N7F6_9GAMM|nr:hypothetical protein [Pseudoalteromonas byunsanensis]OHU95937.1 hypothetical protein BIW53_09030 [Pseudoalteromonas byunsanensis]
MSHVIVKAMSAASGETLSEYRASQMKETRWKNVTQGVSDKDLDNNFDFLNGAVLNRDAGGEVLLTTTGLFGPIRSGTFVHLDVNDHNQVVPSQRAATDEKDSLIKHLNKLHREYTNYPPSRDHALLINGFWTAAVDGAGITGLDDSANVFGSTGQLICDVDELHFPLLRYGDSKESQDRFNRTLAYYGGKLLEPKEEFALGFSQDLWGIQYDQKLPQYITEYQFGPTKGGGLFVEHHPFPHIWLPAQGKDPEFGRHTISRILLGRRVDTHQEDDYFRTVAIEQYHFTMFEIPLDGSALAIRPQCIHNDSFTEGAQTVFLANTAANTVALRHSAPINRMFAGDMPFHREHE